MEYFKHYTLEVAVKTTEEFNKVIELLSEIKPGEYFHDDLFYLNGSDPIFITVYIDDPDKLTRFETGLKSL